MCFKREKGIHFITSRSYYYSFGFRYYGIRANKKTDRLLIVDLKSDKGEITLTFFKIFFIKTSKVKSQNCTEIISPAISVVDTPILQNQ